MLWVVRTQLARRNLNALDFKMLLGQQLELEKKVSGGDRKSGEFKNQKKNQRCQSDTIDSPERTRNRIAKAHNTSPETVARSAALYRAVEVIKEVSPHIGQQIQSGELKSSEKGIRAVGRALKQADKNQKAQIISELEVDFSKAVKLSKIILASLEPARARDAVAKEVFGEFAFLNFPVE